MKSQTITTTAEGESDSIEIWNYDSLPQYTVADGSWTGTDIVLWRGGNDSDGTPFGWMHIAKLLLIGCPACADTFLTDTWTTPATKLFQDVVNS